MYEVNGIALSDRVTLWKRSSLRRRNNYVIVFGRDDWLRNLEFSGDRVIGGADTGARDNVLVDWLANCCEYVTDVSAACQDVLQALDNGQRAAEDNSPSF